ncbi:MAG: aquaporin, partial [Verrucomicrobiota bacterium]|nr:aquaporin [Verrucomicrobiota bacterium]
MLQLAVRNRRESKRIFFRSSLSNFQNFQNLTPRWSSIWREITGAHVASRTVVIDKGNQHMTMDTVDSVNKRSTVAKDQPLRGLPHPFDKLHPRMYASELVGTALLVFLGLSIVIALWGRDAPLASLPISPDARRLLNGFLFGSVGAAIAYSPIGKMSGAHINPAMTFAFWL